MTQPRPDLVSAPPDRKEAPVLSSTWPAGHEPAASTLPAPRSAGQTRNRLLSRPGGDPRPPPPHLQRNGRAESRRARQESRRGMPALRPPAVAEARMERTSLRRAAHRGTEADHGAGRGWSRRRGRDGSRPIDAAHGTMTAAGFEERRRGSQKVPPPSLSESVCHVTVPAQYS